MKINLNAKVIVKLNDIGRQIITEQHNDLCKTIGHKLPDIEIGADGTYKTQLWCLFEDFGQHITLSKKPPFMEIEVEVTDENQS